MVLDMFCVLWWYVKQLALASSAELASPLQLH
jgi:hypothetical protein